MRAKILPTEVCPLTQVPRNTSEFVGASHVTNSGYFQYSLYVRSAEWQNALFTDTGRYLSAYLLESPVLNIYTKKTLKDGLSFAYKAGNK